MIIAIYVLDLMYFNLLMILNMDRALIRDITAKYPLMVLRLADPENQRIDSCTE